MAVRKSSVCSGVEGADPGRWTIGRRAQQGVALLAVLFLGCASLTLASRARATFPGANGKILYTATNKSMRGAQLWVINPDGSGETALTSASEGESLLGQFSRDGMSVVFTGIRAGGDSAVFVRDGNSVARRLRTIGDGMGRPSWTSDGRVLFSSAGEEGGFIMLMGSDGSTPQVMTATEETMNDAPVLSPDPSSPRIAFISDRANGETADLYTMAFLPGATDIKRLTWLDDGGEILSVNWSPDGRWLAYSASDDNGESAHLIDRDGSNHANITPEGVSAAKFPVWSPDGTKIALTLTRPGQADEIAVMNPDRSDLRLLPTASVAAPQLLVTDWQAVASSGSGSSGAHGAPSLSGRPGKGKGSSSRANVACRVGVITLSRPSFRVGQRVSLHFSLNKRAQVELRIRSQGSSAILSRRSITGRPGENRLRFSGRIFRQGRLRTLKTGSYVADVVARDFNGTQSRLRKVVFRVK